MLHMPAKDQLAIEAAAITSANQLIEALLLPALTPRERAISLCALEKAIHLYMREVTREMRKEQVEELEADIHEIEERGDGALREVHHAKGPEGARLRRLVRLKRNLREAQGDGIGPVRLRPALEIDIEDDDE